MKTSFCPLLALLCLTRRYPYPIPSHLVHSTYNLRCRQHFFHDGIFALCIFSQIVLFPSFKILFCLFCVVFLLFHAHSCFPLFACFMCCCHFLFLPSFAFYAVQFCYEKSNLDVILETCRKLSSILRPWVASISKDIIRCEFHIHS